MTTSSEAEMDVENSRMELDRTVEALKDKMTPGQLFDEAAHAMGGAGNEIFSRFVEQAKENPMPLAVMGLGLAWLMTSNRHGSGFPRAERRSFAPAGSAAFGSGATDTLKSASERLGDAAETAKGALKSAGGRLADGVSSAMHSTGSAAGRVPEMASTAAQRASDYVQGAQEGLAGYLEREPLLIGGLGLLAGLALGAALPSTEFEDKLVGAKHDELAEKTKAAAQEALDTVTNVAQATYGAAKDSLSDSAGQDPANRVRQALHDGVAAARDQASDQH